MNPAQGRDWLIPEGDDLRGMFFIHLREASGIVLTREPQKKRLSHRYAIGSTSMPARLP